MKKIIIIISLSMCFLMSTAWSQMRLSTGKRMNPSAKTTLSLANQQIVSADEVIHTPVDYQGKSIMPAIFAYHCNNHDPAVQNCGDHTVPYGNNLFTDVHFTHTWFQMMNTSGVTFTSENSKMFIEVYGQNGELIDVNGGEVWYSNGIIDLLDPSLCGTDGFKPNETIFFYFGTWMHDEYADKNPPYSAKLIANATVPYSTGTKELTVCIHVGWEEIIEDDDGQRYAKGGTLIDKETVILKPSLVIQEQTEQNLLELFK